MNPKFDIVFMGTPDFAVPALAALRAAGHRIVLAVTQPDRPQGRGRRLVFSPVKRAALQLGLEVFQPESVRRKEALDRICDLRPDVVVVAAFGQILPRPLLQLPKHGAINIHASLLPKYRGAAPIHWALLRGETETGVTTMLMEEGLDTGAILLSERTPIGAEDTTGSLHDRLSRIGADLILETLERLSSGRLTPLAQDPSKATYAPMLKKTDGRVDWNRSPADLDRFVRAMDPWPGAFCELDGKRLRIFKLAEAQLSKDCPAGQVVPGFEGELRVAVAGGAVSVLEIQGESGKKLPIADFLRGNPIAPGKNLK